MLIAEEITLNVLAIATRHFQCENFGVKPSFVIVCPEVYWNLFKDLYFFSGAQPPSSQERIKLRVRGVPIISSQEMEKNQIEIVASGFRSDT